MVSRLCFQAAPSIRDGFDCPICSGPVRPAVASLRCSGDEGVRHYFHQPCLGGWAGACRRLQASINRGSAPSCPGCQSCLEVNVRHLASALGGPETALLDQAERVFLEEVLDVGRENPLDEPWGDPFAEERPFVGGLLGYAALTGFRAAYAAAEGAALGVRSAVEGTLGTPARRVRDLGGSMGQYIFGSPREQESPQAAGAGLWGQTYPAKEVGGPSVRPSGRKRALLVGCNYPGTQVELSGCVNDVSRMLELLLRLYGFPREAIRVLVDDGGRGDGVPTRENVLEGARWLLDGVQKGDCLFFHFSGHGAQQLDPHCAEEDGYDETICPTDFREAGMVVDGELFDALIAPLPSGAKLTAVMDCCHSGTGLDLPFTWDPVGRCWAEDDNPCHSAGDVQLISGCEDSQTSADAAFGGSTSSRWSAAGAMTAALCDCLEEAERWASVGSGPAARRDAGSASVGRMGMHLCYDELVDRVHGKLAQRGFEQRPQLTSSQLFDMASRKPFDPSGEAMANRNPELGRHFRRRKHPRHPQDDDSFYTLAGIAPEGVLAASGALLPWAQLVEEGHRRAEEHGRGVGSPGDGLGAHGSPLSAWGSGVGDGSSGQGVDGEQDGDAHAAKGSTLFAGFGYGGSSGAGAGAADAAWEGGGGGGQAAGAGLRSWGFGHDDGGTGAASEGLGTPAPSLLPELGTGFGAPLSGWGLGAGPDGGLVWGGATASTEYWGPDSASGEEEEC